jgi:hypothetical protein
MTPEFQYTKVGPPDHYLVIDLDELLRSGLTLTDVYSALDRGMILSADIYKIISKEDWQKELVAKNSK